MPRLGQHFLRNRQALAAIADTLELTESDIIVEIGPGHGELTEELKTQNLKLKTFKIVGVEKDAKLAEFLRKRFSNDPQIEIIEGDALKIIPQLVHGFELKVRSWKLVGNIPYYLTGKLFRIIGELEHKPAVCVFTIQKEVAERLVAKPPQMNRPTLDLADKKLSESGKESRNAKKISKTRKGGGMNRLAASVGFWARAEFVGRLPRTDFAPPPEVDSAIIRLTTFPARAKINPDTYYRAVRALFSQPRKTILNNLAAGQKKHVTKDDMATRLKKIGLCPDMRPQNLSIENILRIAEFIGE